MIEITTQVWIERLQNFNPGRLALAFDAVEIRCKRWPTVADIVENLPTYPHTWDQAPPAPVERQIAPDHEADARIEEARKRRRQEIEAMVAECARKLDVNLPPGSFGGPPAAEAP